MTVEPGGTGGAPMSERMQSLLSRAVEDQLSEQRQIAGVLTDLRAQLQQINSQVAALRQDSQQGGGSDAALSTVSADVREAVRLLGERLDGVARLVQQRGSDLADLRGMLEQTQGAVRAQGEALRSVGSGLGALPAFGERIGGLQDNLDGLHERLGGLDAVTGGLGALQQRVDAVDQGLRDLRSAFAAVGARMAELPGRAEVDAVAQRSTAPLGELNDRLAGIEQTLASVADQIRDAASAAQQIDDVDDDGNDAQEVAALRAELARFAATAQDDTHELAQRLGALDRRLTEVLDAVTPAEAAETEDRAGEEEYAEDPVLTELADLREALLGEDGLAARVESVGTEDLDVRVGAAVEQAVAASEERLSAHIDEAVLALAEALLRRRTGRPASSAPAPAAPVAPAATPVEEPADAGAEDEADEAGETEPDEQPGALDEQDAPDSSGPPAEGGPAWQTPASPGLPGAAGAEGERRRRPWWRPGD